jgi:glycyl-tRNA synthetase (class II)
LAKSLRSLKTKKRKDVLEEFLDEVVEPSVGNARTLPYTEEGMKRFRELKNAEAFTMFENSIAPNIRN